MNKTIKYYFPVEGKMNKTKTTILTIDWFKKNFLFPIDVNSFEEIYGEVGDSFEIPQLSTIIYVSIEHIKFQGKVEQIIREVTEISDVYHVLLKKIA